MTRPGERSSALDAWRDADPRPEPSRISWDISARWQLETGPEKTSEVEARFLAEATERTRVALEHRNLERHGEGWEATRDAVGSPDGGRPACFADRLKA